jgi:hypothetical protein
LPAWAIDAAQPYAKVLAPRELTSALGSLATPGHGFADCHLIAVCRVNAGGVPFVLATPDGQPFQIDVLRKDARGSSEAIATTDELAVYLLNEGSGTSATHEQRGLAAMALSRALQQQGTRSASIPGLLTLAERHAQHPAGVYRFLG